MRQRIWSGVAIGLVLFALALALRTALAGPLAPFPFLTFFPAIILTALLGGVRPAVLVTLLSAGAAWFMFIGPANNWMLGFSDIVGLGFFLLVAAIDITLIEMLHRTVSGLMGERVRVAALLDARESMFTELQHRVANNMQFVSALLAMQQRQVEDEAASKVLEEAGVRLRAMARIHRRLYDPANADRAFGPLVEELCHELLQATGAKNIVCRVEVADVRLPLDRVLALSMIASEALTNAVKHAFPDDRPGTIRVSLEHLPTNEYDFVIADDGRGIPPDFSVATSKSLGMRIVQSLAQQLRGEFSYGPAKIGSEFRLRFQGGVD